MGKSILILDDDFLSVGKTQISLERMGYSSTATYTPSAFKEAILSKSYDLALVDIDLNSTQTGLEVAKEINLKDICPFIILSNHDDYVSQVDSAGASSYLLKCAPDEQLNLTIQLVLMESKDEYVSLGPENRRIRKTDILAISSFGHLKVVHILDTDSIAFHASFQNLRTAINLPSLMQVAGGYLVNMDLITAYTATTITLRNSIHLCGNRDVIQTINIGRRFRSEIARYLANR